MSSSSRRMIDAHSAEDSQELKHLAALNRKRPLWNEETNGRSWERKVREPVNLPEAIQNEIPLNSRPFIVPNLPEVDFWPS